MAAKSIVARHQRLFNREIRIPGAMFDHVKQQWKKPHPLGFVYHWKTAAMKLKHFTKPMDEWEKNKAKWFTAVPIHEGVDNILFRRMSYKKRPYKSPPDLYFKNGFWFPVTE